MRQKKAVITIRLDPDDHRRVKQAAAWESLCNLDTDLSMNRFCLDAVLQAVSESEVRRHEIMAAINAQALTRGR